MKVKARLFGVLYSVVMAFCLAVVVSLAAASVGGHPITWESFGWSLLQGTVVGTVVGLVLPIRKMGDAWCAALGAETKLARALVTPLLIGTLFLVVLNFYFTAVNTGFATFMTDAGPVTFVARFMEDVYKRQCLRRPARTRAGGTARRRPRSGAAVLAGAFLQRAASQQPGPGGIVP